MAETVRSYRIQVKIQGIVDGDDGAELKTLLNYDRTFANGTGTNQIGAVWQDNIRALNTTTEDLQLDALTDFQGATMSSNNNVKFLCVQNLDTDTGDKFILGGSAGGNAWDTMFVDATDKMNVGPDGLFLNVSPVDGFAITAGDDLGVEAVDNSTYKIIMGFDNA